MGHSWSMTSASALKPSQPLSMQYLTFFLLFRPFPTPFDNWNLTSCVDYKNEGSKECTVFHLMSVLLSAVDEADCLHNAVTAYVDVNIRIPALH